MDSILKIVSQISTPLILAGVVIAVLSGIFRAIIDKSPDWSKKDASKIILKIINWIGVIAILAVILGFIGYFAQPPLSKSIKEDSFSEIKIPLFTGAEHLGDNTFHYDGGNVDPKHDAPTSTNVEDIIYYDKQTKQFSTEFGLTTGVKFLAGVFQDYYSKFNLDAWKHIFAMSKSDLKQSDVQYSGSFVQIDTDIVLVWRENQGNFYHKKAIIGRTKGINLFASIMDQGIDPRKVKINRVWIRLKGFHGGRRKGQDDNVDFLVGDNRYNVKFIRDLGRNEEFIELELKSTHLNINDPSKITIFSIVVLPYQEQLPLPPPDSKYQQTGPAHFRDVEIGSVKLVLQLSI